MADARDRFVAAARARGITVATRPFPDGTRTARDAASAIGCALDQIVKSLVFIADGEPVLALTAGGNRVDERRLADAAAAQTVRMANAGEVREATGYAIGGTPPFGHPAPLRTFVDPRLLDFPEVWAAAGTPRDNFPIAPETLVSVTGATVAPIAEDLPADDG